MSYDLTFDPKPVHSFVAPSLQTFAPAPHLLVLPCLPQLLVVPVPTHRLVGNPPSAWHMFSPPAPTQLLPAPESQPFEASLLHVFVAIPPFTPVQEFPAEETQAL